MYRIKIAIVIVVIVTSLKSFEIFREQYDDDDEPYDRQNKRTVTKCT